MKLNMNVIYIDDDDLIWKTSPTDLRTRKSCPNLCRKFIKYTPKTGTPSLSVLSVGEEDLKSLLTTPAKNSRRIGRNSIKEV